LSAGTTLNSTSTLLDPQTDELQTLLSALLTNQQTCLDGVDAAASAWSVRNGLAVPLSNSTKLYSVSLSLFTRAWVRKKKAGGSKSYSKGRKLLFHEVEVSRDGGLPLKMSSTDREFFERRTGRRLLQSTNSVSVSAVVYVSQDGTGNFTTVSSAVAAAPNNTDGTQGYFLIHVRAGVYHENVTISKHKKYVMMIGDGINQTVITGSRNNVDGWTTFRSATFGEFLCKLAQIRKPMVIFKGT